MTKPWIEISRFYTAIDSGRLEGMGRLVSAIESSPFADGLFAWTSVWDLCIAQTPVEYPYHGPYLRISPNLNRTLEFRYIDTVDTEKQRRRVVPEEAAFERLQRFFADLHWFTFSQRT